MEAFTFELLPAQQSAFERIKAFLESDNDVFILKGYAGTGSSAGHSSINSKSCSRLS